MVDPEEFHCFISVPRFSPPQSALSASRLKTPS
jgi:hypothetical protein